MIVVVLLVGAAITASALGGHFSGRFRVPGFKLKVAGGREAKPMLGEAKITRAKAKRDVIAEGCNRAAIEDADAERDVIARTGEPREPKP